MMMQQQPSPKQFFVLFCFLAQKCFCEKRRDIHIRSVNRLNRNMIFKQVWNFFVTVVKTNYSTATRLVDSFVSMPAASTRTDNDDVFCCLFSSSSQLTYVGACFTSVGVFHYSFFFFKNLNFIGLF